MRYGNLAYFTQEALLTLRQKRRLHAIAITMISIAVLILALFLLVVCNTRLLLQELGAQAKVIVFLNDPIQPAQRHAIEAELWHFPGTQSVDYVSKEQAWNDFTTWFRDGKLLLEGLQQNPLPASYVMRLSPHAQRDAMVPALAQRLSRLPGVEEVEYGARWRQGFQSVVRGIELLSLVSGVLLSLGIVFIIANTVRLTIYTRLHEIEIMHLVGATERFIQGPFLITGMVQGFLGALIALGVLFGLYETLIDRLNHILSITFDLPQLPFLSWLMIGGLVAGSTLLGYIGSALTLSRTLRALHVSY